jgi:hypothetical protein
VDERQCIVDDDRRTRLVFIERDLDGEFIRKTLESFVQAGDGVFGRQ